MIANSDEQIVTGIEPANVGSLESGATCCVEIGDPQFLYGDMFRKGPDRNALDIRILLLFFVCVCLFLHLLISIYVLTCIY